MRYSTVKPYILPLLLSAIWCLLLLVLLQRAMRNEEHHATELARLQARTLCAQMLDTRAWNAAHGGVYVRESAYGAPNPWLPAEMRRAALASGESLVLINPAYMSRQIAERSSTKGARLRITSSNPLRPESRADGWEAAALRSISLGEPEVFKLDESTPDQQNFRYMAPLRTEADCLPCHANSRLHEVRGGISVTLEAEPFLQTIQEYNTALGYTYALMGLAGILGIGSLSFAINRKRLLAEHKEQMNSAFLANMSMTCARRSPASWVWPSCCRAKRMRRKNDRRAAIFVPLLLRCWRWLRTLPHTPRWIQEHCNARIKPFHPGKAWMPAWSCSAPLALKKGWSWSSRLRMAFRPFCWGMGFVCGRRSATWWAMR